MQVNMHEAKTQLSKLAERARAGEEVIIAKAGTPYVRLMPIATPGKPRRPGRLRKKLRDVPDSVWFEPDEELETLFSGGDIDP